MNKTIKRSLAVMLSVFLLLAGLAGCKDKATEKYGKGFSFSDQEATKALYDAAAEKIRGLDELNYTLTIDIRHEDSGNTNFMGMRYLICMANTDGELSKMTMQGTYSGSGTQGYKAYVYLKDGYYYINMAGFKAKILASDLKTLAEVVEIPEQQPLHSDAFTKIGYKTENGSTVVRFTADGETVLGELEGALGSVSFKTGDEIKYDGVAFSNVEGIAVVGEDGFLTEIDLMLPMKYQSADVVISYHIVYNDPGKPVTFDFPSFNDYYDYTDYFTQG